MRSNMRESFIGARNTPERDSFSMRNRFESFSRASTPSLNNSVTSDRPEDLSDGDLMRTYHILLKNNRQRTLENDIYKRYMERVQPDLLSNLDQTIASIAAKEIRVKNLTSMIARPQGGGLHSSMSLATLSNRGSVVMSNRGSIMSFATSGRGYTTPTLPSIEASMYSMNIEHKQEMVVREMEEIGRELESFRRLSVAKLGARKAKAEQLQLGRDDVVMTRERFTEEVVVNGVEALTQKIPAERFVRFMTESLKATDTEIGCLRLRTNRLRAACVHVQRQLVLKRELNESLCPVDFAQIKIANETQAKEMCVMNEQLIEMKAMSASFKIRVSKAKHELTGMETDLARLNESIRVITERIGKYEDKVVAIKHEIDREKGKLLKLQDRRKEFIVPDPLDYLKLKMRIFDLKKEIKTWRRKSNVLHATLVNTSRLLKRRERKNMFPTTSSVVKTSNVVLNRSEDH